MRLDYRCGMTFMHSSSKVKEQTMSGFGCIFHATMDHFASYSLIYFVCERRVVSTSESLYLCSYNIVYNPHLRHKLQVPSCTLHFLSSFSNIVRHIIKVDQGHYKSRPSQIICIFQEPNFSRINTDNNKFKQCCALCSDPNRVQPC